MILTRTLSAQEHGDFYMDFASFSLSFWHLPHFFRLHDTGMLALEGFYGWFGCFEEWEEVEHVGFERGCSSARK